MTDHRDNTHRLLVTVATGLCLPVLVVVVWHIAASRDNSVVPAIGEVFDVLHDAFQEPPDLDSASLATGTIASILRVALGFSLAAVVAVPLGICIGRIRWLRDLTRPMISVLTVVSPVAWMPLAIIVFGIKTSIGTVIYGQDEAWRADILDQLVLAVIIVIASGAFFPIVLNTSAGVNNVRTSHEEAVRVLGGNNRQIFLEVVIPSALPSIATGLRIGAGVSWRIMVAAEFFPGTRSGLGHMILTAQGQFEYKYNFAAIIVIAALGLAIDGCFALFEYRASRWRREET